MPLPKPPSKPATLLKQFPPTTSVAEAGPPAEARQARTAEPTPPPPGEAVLELDRATLRERTITTTDLSLSVREGEVVGLAGLEGSGQRTLLRAAAGLIEPASGTMRVGGRDLTGRGYRAFLDAGVHYLPAGRLEEGLVAGLTISEHFLLAGVVLVIVHSLVVDSGRGAAALSLIAVFGAAVSALGVGLQRLHASRHVELAAALPGREVGADVVGLGQERDALPPGTRYIGPDGTVATR